MNVLELEKMWSAFADIPANLEEEIEVDLYWKEKGTYRFDIWHWFDQNLPNRIVKDFI